jgi:hypothetical protein
MPKRADLYGNFGAGGQTRTDDLLITNQLLYQLSYAGEAGAASVQRGEFSSLARHYSWPCSSRT